MPANMSDEVRMVGVLPSAGADPIPVEIYQPSSKETFEVVQDTAADLNATVVQDSDVRETHGRIPSGATQVSANIAADNATQVIHTVTAGKTLYLSAVTFSGYNTSGGGDIPYIFVTNAADAVQYYFFVTYMPDTTGLAKAVTFNPPIEIAAGYKVKIVSPVASLKVYGFIHGYEE